MISSGSRDQCSGVGLAKTVGLALWMLALGWGVVGCRTSGPRFDARSDSPSLLRDLRSVNETNALPADLRSMPTNLYVLGPGDVIEIELIGDQGTLTTAKVGPDGKIYYNLLPGLDVWGLTLAQTKALLERELARYYTEPQVAITLRTVESSRVWVLGRVNAPGIYPMATPLTLLEAVSMAGGVSVASAGLTTEELADLRHSFVLRQGELLPVDFYRLIHEGDLSQNIYLRPDDFVFFPSSLAQEIYVLGAVRQPRAVPYRDRVTLTYVVSSAGGTIPDAFLSHVAVVRGSLAEPKIAIVDYQAILTGQATDILLEPRDIVYVPFTPYRYLTRYLDLILNSFVSTVAANEGAFAVSKRASGVGLSVSPTLTAP
jgi:protein involved in polysaccharide export with SLBB domain